MLKTYGAAILGLLLSTAAGPAQASQIFDFSFTAPLISGDVASGSGTLVTDDADQNGHYNFLSASGSYVAYQGESNTRAIDAAFGLSDFSITDGYLFKDLSGAFVTDGVMFFERETFNFIGFQNRENGLYSSFYTEVGTTGATLTFIPAVATIPELTTWGMMILGLGAVGVAMRRSPKVRVTYA